MIVLKVMDGFLLKKSKTKKKKRNSIFNIFQCFSFGPIDDFVLLTDNNTICIVDREHRLWINQWDLDRGFFELLYNDEFSMSHQRYLICVNSELLCFTDCEEEILIFSDSLTGKLDKLIV